MACTVLKVLHVAGATVIPARPVTGTLLARAVGPPYAEPGVALAILDER